MADTKITGLTNFDSSNTPYWPPAPASDVIPIVDISDATMAASGTTKKISINNLLSSSPTATGALTVTGLVTAGSAAITGAATVTGAANLNGAVNLSTSGTPTVTLGSTSTYGLLQGGGTNASSIYLNGATRSGVPAYAFYAAAEHQFYNSTLATLIATLNTTALGIGVAPVAGNGAIQLSAGVGFPATQVASANANTLDDYEEGTWTPTITFATLSVGVTYSTQTAIYTKVGRIVHFSGRIDLSSKGTSIGGAAIAGLPFAANTGAASVGFQSSIAPSGSQAILTIDGTTLIVRYASTTTTAQSTDSDFSNSSIIIFSGTYAV